MKIKKWRIMALATLAFLLLASTAIPVLAQSDEPAADSARPAPRGALAIVAPWTGLAGKELTMRVFLREDQEPFPGAGVWALTQEQAEALKEGADDCIAKPFVPDELVKKVQGILDMYREKTET